MLRPMSTIDRIYIYIYLGLKESYDLCLLQTVYICRFEGKLRPIYLSRLEGTLRPISAIDIIYI